MDVIWKRGEYIKLFATMKVRLGSNAHGVTHIEAGDIAEFDGTMLKYSGAEFACPSLRGAVKAEWLIPEEYSPGAQTPQATIPQRQIAKAQTINTDLSRVQRSPVASMESSEVDEETVLNVSDRSEKVEGSTRTEPKKLVRVTDQDGKVVGKIRSAAKATPVDVSRDSEYARTLDAVELPKPIGKIPVKNTITREGVHITSNVGSVSQDIQELNDEGTVVGKVRKTDKNRVEGIEIKDTSKSAVQATQQNQQVPMSNGKVKINTKIPPQIRIAQYIYPDFPSDWSFTGKMKERLDQIGDYKNNPAFLEALYAAEGDNVRRILQAEYPNQFKE